MISTATLSVAFLVGRARSFLIVCLFVTLFAFSSSAQTTSATDGTTPSGLSPGIPLGSYSPSGLENINIYNGNLNFRLPLVQVGGRGTAGHTIALTLDSKSWRVRRTPQGESFIHTPVSSSWGGLSVAYGGGVLQGRQIGIETVTCSDPQRTIYKYTLTRLTFTSPDGTEYDLRDEATDGQPRLTQSICSTLFNPSRGRVFRSADGTAATFIADADVPQESVTIGLLGNALIYPSGHLYLRDGTRYRIDVGVVTSLRDRNGNQVTFGAAITDSLNRQVTIAYDVNEGVPYGVCDRITFTGVNGQQRVIRLSKTNLGSALRGGFSLQTIFELFPLNGSSGSTTHDPTIVSSVWLPDGSRYRLFYNSYAELSRVELPTGGAFEYDYTPGAGLRSGVNEYQIYRRLVERRVYSDGVAVSGKTVYPIDGGGDFTGVIEEYTPTGTLLEKSNHIFSGNAAQSLFAPLTGVSYSAWREGRELQTEDVAVSGGVAGSVVQRVNQTFQQRAAVSWWSWWLAQGHSGSSNDEPANDPRLTESVTTLVDTNRVAKQTLSYDQYNNQTDVYDYDFGTGAAPAFSIRRTHFDYLTTNAVNGAVYDNPPPLNLGLPIVHLRSLPLRQIVYSVNPGTGAQRWEAQTEYEYDRYDESTYHAALVNRVNISGLDGTFTTSYQPRGNVTQVDRWLNVGGSDKVKNYAQFDIAGNGVRAIDGLGNATDLDFSDRYGSSDGDARLNAGASELAGQTSCAFATKTTNALGHETYTQLDYYLGKPVDSEDANNVKFSIYYNDGLDRPTRTISAVGTAAQAQTNLYYDDLNHVITTARDKDSYAESGNAGNPGGLVEKAYCDGLGRTVRTASYEGNTGAGNTWSIVVSEFDEMGRVRRTTNPFRASVPDAAVPGTPNWTTTAYDALGRVKSVTTPDGAIINKSYNGNQVTVTDQAGKARRNTTDAFGRLTQVIEDPSGLAYTTNYRYDVLGNLRLVEQGTAETGIQRRYFAYDGLSRLIRATNPEQVNSSSLAYADLVSNNASWVLAYYYDANNNLSARVTSPFKSTYYGYDALNRNTTIDYTDGTPSSTRVYDGATNGKGRFWLHYTAQGSTGYSATVIDSYDALGRVLQQRQHFFHNDSWGMPYSFSRTYNLAGNLAWQINPSGRAVVYNYDQAGRVSHCYGNLGDGQIRTYTTGILYNPAGQLIQEQFGTTIPLIHNRHFNNRMQLYDVRLGSGADGQGAEWTWNRGALRLYYANNSVFGGGTNNNGNLYLSEHFIPTSENATTWMAPQSYYGYDALNRVNVMVEVGVVDGVVQTGAPTQSYTYDQWGNRLTVGGYNARSYNFSGNQNRLQPVGGGMQYDNAGNLTFDPAAGAGARTYDAENRMITVGGGVNTYAYDADGRRVRRVVGQETWHVYGIDGELVAEYPLAGAPSAPLKEYVYRGGQLLVAVGCDTMRWLVTDHLGTPRIEVDLTGSLSGVKRHDYLPFGEELMAGTGVRSASHGYPTFAGSDCVRQQFGGKERDNETGLDYFNGRYYSSVLGRFTSVDPENAGGNILDPQTLNGYVFARNSPLVFSDPGARRHLVCGPTKGGSCGFIDDDAFQRYRRAVRPVGLASTGNEDSLASGSIVVQAPYELIGMDDSVRRFIFEDTRAGQTYPKSVGSTAASEWNLRRRGRAGQ